MESSNNSTLNPAALTYVQAVNTANLQALVDVFTPAATIVTTGHATIETWTRNEVMGGNLEVLEVANYPSGQDLLVHFSSKESSGLRTHYRFDIASDKISGANLQYA
jgi:hypothetical protein